MSFAQEVPLIDMIRFPIGKSSARALTKALAQSLTEDNSDAHASHLPPKYILLKTTDGGLTFL
jgi:hypothetical protein